MKNLKYPQYLIFLASLNITSLMLSTILVYKITLISGLSISTGTFILPVSFWICDIISEVYGYHTARSIIIYSLICLGFFDIGASLLANTPYPEAWQGQLAFSYVLTPLPKIFFADIIGLFLGSLLNAYLISFWGFMLKGRYFCLRSIGASFAGETLFTFLVMAIIFFGTMDLKSYFQAAIFAVLYKLVFSFVMSFFGQFIVFILKKLESTSSPHVHKETTDNINNFNQSSKTID